MFFIRKFLVLLLLFGPATGSLAQALSEEEEKKNSWRTLAGYAFFGGGDISGLGVVNEYTRYLTPHIKVGPNFKFSSAKFINRYKSGLNFQEDDFLGRQANIFEIGLMGYYEYMNPSRTGLELGLGVFYRNLQHTITTGPYTTYEDLSTGLLLGFSEVAEYSENTVGFNVYIGFVIQAGNTISLNLGGLVQSDTGGNTGFGALGGLSIRF